MVFPPVVGRLDLADVAFLDEAVDLVCRVGRGDPHEGGKFIHRGTAQSLNGLHAEGLHRRQTGLTILKAAEDLLVKVQLELGVHVKKSVFQHGCKPSFPRLARMAGKRRLSFRTDGEGQFRRTGQFAVDRGLALADAHRPAALGENALHFQHVAGDHLPAEAGVFHAAE